MALFLISLQNNDVFLKRTPLPTPLLRGIHVGKYPSSDLMNVPNDISLRELSNVP